MSLHLGNLSSRISKDELQLVFRRFGRCNVRIKDKYGFVVFDYPANAEKALKTLRGKRICGQIITLSWSNRQPLVFRSSPGGSKSYEPQIRKHSLKQNVDSRFVTNGERDHSSSYDRREIGVGKNHFEDDGWRDQGLHSLNENGYENDMTFDRYEPCQSDGKIELEEYEEISPLSNSPSARKSRENMMTKHDGRQDTSDYTNISKSRKACFACGELGHFMNKCPLKLMTRSQGVLNPRSNAPMRHHEGTKDLHNFRNHHRQLEGVNSPHPQITPNYMNKSGKRKKYESYEKDRSKKVPRLLTSSVRNVCNSSSSRSISRSLSQSLSPSHSRSNFFTAKKNSRSSSLKFSKSQHSESKALESRSMSLKSLSVELDRDLSPSQDNGQMNELDSTRNVSGLVHREPFSEQDQCLLGGSIAFNLDDSATKIRHEDGTSVLEKQEMKSDLLEETDTDFGELKSDVSKDGDRSAKNSSLHGGKEIQGSQTKYILEDVTAPKSLTSLKANISSSVNISSEEICMVLKYYGLHYPEEKAKNTPVETYLGAARLWPWDIIYYRRLKKCSG